MKSNEKSAKSLLIEMVANMTEIEANNLLVTVSKSKIGASIDELRGSDCVASEEDQSGARK